MEHNTPLSPILYAKVLGRGEGGSGLTEDVKQALLNAFNHVAWTDEHGQDYVDALQAALYPIDHITAVYTQSGTVYDTDSLDSLKADLVVTAFYQSGGSETVTGYELSGTLTAGTSTITVSYGGKTATFDVVVSPTLILSDILTLDGIQNTRSGHNASATTWEDLSENHYDFAKLSGANSVVWGDDHAIFNATNRILQLNGVDPFENLTSFSLEYVASISGNGSQSVSGTYRGLILIGGKIGGNSMRVDAVNNNVFRNSVVAVTLSDVTASVGEIMHVVISCTATEAKLYANGVLVETKEVSLPISNKTVFNIGGNSDGSTRNWFLNGNIYRLAISSNALTAEEVAARYSACKARFGL